MTTRTKKRTVKKAARRPAAPRKAAPKPAPAKPETLESVFLRLRKVLLPYAKHMVVKFDGPGIYYLESAPVPKYDTEVFFGAVKTGKRFVSFHLMPVDVFPELRRSLSPALKKRMKDNSTFNFTALEPATVRELAALTRQGYQGYRRGGVFAA